MNAFLKSIKILLLILVAVVHVHLSMFTVENPLNPSFWVLQSFFGPSSCRLFLLPTVVTLLRLGLKSELLGSRP